MRVADSVLVVENEPPEADPNEGDDPFEGLVFDDDFVRSAAIVEDYAAAQLTGLKVALLAAAAIAFGSLWFSRQLPATRQRRDDEAEAASRVSADERPG